MTLLNIWRLKAIRDKQTALDIEARQLLLNQHLTQKEQGIRMRLKDDATKVHKFVAAGDDDVDYDVDMHDHSEDQDSDIEIVQHDAHDDLKQKVIVESDGTVFQEESDGTVNIL
eukprot:54953_1